MKRLLVVFTVLVMVTGFSLGRASASTNQKVGEAASAAVVVPTAVPGADVIDCGAALFFGGVTFVGSFFAGGGIFSWLGFTNAGYTADQIRRNNTCAAESFYDHIGYRKLCWEGHFIGWNPVSGHAMFNNGDGACNISPITADKVLCEYLQWPDRGVCDDQFWHDMWIYISAHDLGVLW